ncbi:MAG: HAD family phosphatase [Marivirga sp.]|nr:HAD family phosphatase [Marivirga sp.]
MWIAVDRMLDGLIHYLNKGFFVTYLWLIVKTEPVKQNPEIKNLIFDLGGVIIDLSIDHTIEAFAALSGIEKKRVTELYSSPGFELYEKGLMDDNEFRDYVRQVFSVQSSALEIDTCWLAMLRGLPLKKLQLLERLKQMYNVYLLSNTNSIHLEYINNVMLPGIVPGANSLDAYFHKAYYSHIMKKRKPDADIFQQVLKENNLSAHETLFLDDNLGNIEGANLVGIKTVHVFTPDLILDYFNE